MVTRFVAGAAVLFDFSQNGFVIFRVHHNRDVVEILRRRAQHGRSADVDVFDAFLEGHTGLEHRLFKRIEIDDEQVDIFNPQFFTFFLMLRIVPNVQNAAVNQRMQGFNPTVQTFWKSCNI